MRRNEAEIKVKKTVLEMRRNEVKSKAKKDRPGNEAAYYVTERSRALMQRGLPPRN